ncbi:STRA6 [Mytilus edulis]|uniref:STRA6 n=1 Tax=Mytilus edulis TaxID=6550 RepID=A0A8S3VIM3_MYTED|nr:STRA6 [Mytilus edulis]
MVIPSVSTAYNDISSDSGYIFYQLMVISSVSTAYNDLSSDSGYIFYQLMVISSVSTAYDDLSSNSDPMDIYEMKNRISFIAAFGAISFLFYEVILNSRYIFPFTGHLGVRFFVILFSVVCYGFIYFPIFAALTLKSPIGYAIGSLHVWVFTYKAYDDTFGCASKIDSLDQFLVVLRDWPKLLAISYLAIAMPVRFLISVKLFPHIPMINPRENTVGPMKDELEKIRCSFQGRHIRKILDPPVETVEEDKKNLIGLYKGSKIHIPPRSEKSNPSIMVGTMRYTGYQVGYILWGYLIQWSIFFLIFNVIALIINLYRIGAADFITNLIKQLWPAPITALALNLIQILLAKFVFLQERGNLLAIDNRRGFFFLTYFVFFYNTFLGVVSCLLRIIKAIVIGALFLGRLDHSTLPRRFQLMDPGFDAYVGFMHMENAHFNPIVLTFLSLLKRKTDSDTKNKKGIENELYDVKYNMKGHPHRLAIRRWQLSCMLHYNPQLRIMRKQYLSNLRPSKAGIVTSKNEVKDKPSVSVMSLSILSVLLESAINSTEYNTSTQVSNIDCDPKELTQEGQYLFYQLMLIPSTNQFLLVLRDWPKLASMFYLAVMLPARFLFSLNIIPHIPIINPKPNTVGPHADTMDKIRSSLAGKHVRNTFQPPRTIIEDHG